MVTLQSNNRNSRKRRQIWSKLAIETPEQQRTCSGVFVLILIYLTPFSTVCILDFEQVNVCLVKLVKEITNIK